MPIKDKSVYPKGWKQFSEHIRFERAGNKCEECGAENGKVGARDRFGDFWSEDSIHSLNSGLGEHFFGADFDFRMTRIVLTVAHLNATGDVCRCQERTGFLCLNPDHVKAMCQKCHNTYDAPVRRANARRTIAAKKDAQRGLLG